MKTLTLEVPPGLDPAAARLLYAVGLFQEGHVSVGRAARIAGLSYRAFLDALQARGIPAFTYTEEDLAADLRAIAAWEGQGDPDPEEEPPDG